MREYRLAYRNAGVRKGSDIRNDFCGNICNTSSYGSKKRHERKDIEGENSFCSVYFVGISLKTGGSFTVEASLIVPMILFTIMTFLNIAIYCHDRAVLFSAGQKACLISVYEEKENMTLAAKEYFEEETGRELMGKWEVETFVTADDEIIELNATANSTIRSVEVNSRARLIPSSH